MERKQAMLYTGLAFFVVAFMGLTPITIIGLATDHLDSWLTIDLAIVAVFAVIAVVVFFMTKPEQPTTSSTPASVIEQNPIGEEQKTETREGYCPWCGRYIGFGCPPKCPWCGGDLEGKA